MTKPSAWFRWQCGHACNPVSACCTFCFRARIHYFSFFYPERREQELKAYPEWRKFWKKLQKRDKPEQREQLEWERHFLQRLMVKFMEILESISDTEMVLVETVRYCERFLEFLIDLEALLPTRRFLNTVLDDCHLVVRCSLAPLNQMEEGKLFSQVSLFIFSIFLIFAVSPSF